LLVDNGWQAAITRRQMVAKFEIIDMGAAPADTVAPGNTFRSLYDADVMGTGVTAKAAFDDALNQLALDGYETRLLHEVGIEAGYYSQDAQQPAAGIYEPAEGEDVGNEVIEYHVLIRFQDTQAVDDKEPK